jgi:hypothetical protein
LPPARLARLRSVVGVMPQMNAASALGRPNTSEDAGEAVVAV